MGWEWAGHFLCPQDSQVASFPEEGPTKESAHMNAVGTVGEDSQGGGSECDGGDA